jgi:hypothetical protein
MHIAKVDFEEARELAGREARSLDRLLEESWAR